MTIYSLHIHHYLVCTRTTITYIRRQRSSIANISAHARQGGLQTGANCMPLAVDTSPASPKPLRSALHIRLLFPFQDFRPLHGILSRHGRKQAAAWTCLVCGTSLPLIQKVRFFSFVLRLCITREFWSCTDAIARCKIEGGKHEG